MQRTLATSILVALAPLGVRTQDPAASTKGGQPYYGVDLPAQPAPGVMFPTPEGRINGWVFGDTPDETEIYSHGWGLWAGLTTPTGTTAFGIENARIYQTWLSPSGIVAALRGAQRPTSIALRTPLQQHGNSPGATLVEPSSANADGMHIDDSVAEVVAYSPSAARHTFENELLFTEVLNEFLERGYASIPRFPSDSITIKPVYKLISSDELNRIDGKELYAMPAWPGIPSLDTTGKTPDEVARIKAIEANGFPPKDWDQCVYVDVNNSGASSASGVDPTCKNPSADNTYGLGDFITIPITGADQAHFQFLSPSGVGKDKRRIEVGDILLLVGMHVATRETERWTWQSFWWAANPSKPGTPSSPVVAGARPAELCHEASHYAMVTAYSMLLPAQPLKGGRNTGELVVGFNPHLEAEFNPQTFGRTDPVATPDGIVKTDLGIQSNCMTCHGLANYGSPGAVYGANFYLSMDDPARTGGLDVDFAWSIASEAVPRRKPK